MEVGPDMLGVWSERKSIEVEICCLFVHPFEGMGDTNVDPHSHIVGTDVKSSVVELDCLVSSAQMSQSSSYFVHKQIVGGIQVQSSVEEVDGDIVLSLDEEEDSAG